MLVWIDVSARLCVFCVRVGGWVGVFASRASRVHVYRQRVCPGLRGGCAAASKMPEALAAGGVAWDSLS